MRRATDARRRERTRAGLSNRPRPLNDHAAAERATMNQGINCRRTNGSALGLRGRLALGTALATSAFVGGYRGYVRRAFADCVGSLGSYICSGVTTATQTLSGAPLTVTTLPGF